MWRPIWWLSRYSKVTRAAATNTPTTAHSLVILEPLLRDIMPVGKNRLRG